MGFKVPNWAQAMIAKAAGLDPDKVAVKHESESSITFLQFMPRREINISKTTGAQVITEDPYAARKRSAEQRGSEQLRMAEV